MSKVDGRYIHAKGGDEMCGNSDERKNAYNMRNISYYKFGSELQFLQGEPVGYGHIILLSMNLYKEGGGPSPLYCTISY